MSLRSLYLTLGSLSVLAAGLWWQSVSSAGQITAPQPAPGPDELQSITLVFGTKDAEPAKWDGSAALSSGKIERIRGHHFTADSKILDGNAWQCSTHPWAGFAGGMHPNERPQPYATQVEPIGVTIDFRAPADAALRVRIQGKEEFAIRPMDIPPNGAIFPMNSDVEVYRTPPVEQLTDGEYEDDYPAIAADGDTVWAAWQGYKNDADRIFLKRRVNGKWGERVEVTEKPGDLFQPAVAAAKGKAAIVWSEREGETWNLKARVHDGSVFGKTETVAPGLFHRATADANGNFHVIYQSWRKGRSTVYLRSLVSGRWAPEITLSDPQRDMRANDWYPAVAAGRDGALWTAWETYAGGSYNILLREVRNGKPAAIRKVTSSPRFHSHASLAVDSGGRVWIAYDEAPENWGKDVGFLFSGGTGIYESRTIKIAILDKGRWMTTLQQPGEAVPHAFKRYFHTPRLAADSSGRVWLLARPRTSARRPTSLWAAGGKWEVVATSYSGDRWSELILIPESVGRNEGEFQVAAGQGGDIYLALAGDHRLWGGAPFGQTPGNHDILFATLRAPAGASPVLAPLPPEPPAGQPVEAREQQQVAALRSHAIQAGGKTYRIYRGDLHRHTDISADGAGDGSLFDSYRYAMDAAAMDYLMVTDHQSGAQEYTWWRTQKSADMFHTAGFFTTLYGTERSLGYPNGHRNLVFTRRGVRILPITPAEQKASTGPVLYPYLRKNGGIATSHTSHTTMGTDWRDNDPELEPIVEIYQGARTSAEHDGAPLSPTSSRTELWAGGYRPLGYVWNAWAKGYKLGVQASSDHVSTHTSYACVIAEDSSRDALADAMRKRHTYAATTNILMDYRVTADGNTYLQGDAFKTSSLPELTATITGTGPLKKVVVVRDNQYVYSQEPGGETFNLRYRENSLAAGEHYYYVRVEQKDGHLAWSSPVWVQYAGR
jgi:hypothetical protein